MSSKLSPTITKVLLDGKDAYSQEKYKSTLVIYTKALEGSNPMTKSDRLQLLDLRIGTYVKLRKLDRALADSKAMIKVNRSEARGYLRCGQIEKLMNNYTMAARWYQQGLKHVDPSDKLYSKLSEELEKVQSQTNKMLVLSKPTDPMTSLPIEVVEQILRFLDHRQHVAILRVSKSWKQLLSMLPPLIDSLDFRGTKKPVSYHSLVATMKTMSKQPKLMSVVNLTEAAARSVRSHLEKWTNYRGLEYLEFNDSRLQLSGLRFDQFDLKTIIFGPFTAIEMTNVHSILKLCNKLETAKFHNVKTSRYSPDALREQLYENENLQVLEIFGQTDTNHSTTVHTFGHFPNLEKLACRNFAIIAPGMLSNSEMLDLSTLIRLRHLELSHCLIAVNLILPDSLYSLNLADSIFRIVDISSPTALKNLQVLDVYRCTTLANLLPLVKDDDGKGVLTDLSIDLDFDSGAAQDIFMNLVMHENWLQNVRRLRVKWVSLQDSHYEMLFSGCPSLQTLVLEDTAVTGVFLMKLLSSARNQMRNLTLKNCIRISADAIDWARKKGIQVEIRNANTLNDGGRQIHIV